MTDKYIKIGFNPDFPPFTYMEEGAPHGLVIERVAAAFSAADIPFKFIPTGLAHLTSDLMDGTLDVLAAVAIIPSRRATLSFSDPIIVSGAAWFVPIDHDFEQGDIPARIVTPEKGPLVAQINKQYPSVEVVTCNDYDDALQIALSENDNTVAAALNWHVGRQLIIQPEYDHLFHVPQKPFNSIALAMATRSGDPDNILEQLNKYIKKGWGDELGNFRGDLN